MKWLRKFRLLLLPQAIRGPFVGLYEWAAVPGLLGFHRRVASEVAATVASGRVLDVGTGPAHLLVEIGRHNPDLRLVGVDLSRPMLRAARAVMREETTARAAAEKAGEPAAPDGLGAGRRLARLVRADVRNLPFCDGAFDLVVSTLSLHHWRDPARGIQECVRVTAPGGQCWIYDLRADAPASAHAHLATGGWLRRTVLGWVFKFHGVHPDQFAVRPLERWLGDGVAVRVEVSAAYLKLNIRRTPCGPDGGASRCGRRKPVLRDCRASLAHGASVPS